MSATMQRLVLAMLAAPCAAMRLAPMAPRLVTRAGVVSMAENRFSEKILDNSLPDPVYDEMGGDGGYLGKSNVGFSQGAETWNGRFAMMGLLAAFVTELVSGKRRIHRVRVRQVLVAESVQAHVLPLRRSGCKRGAP